MDVDLICTLINIISWLCLLLIKRKFIVNGAWPNGVKMTLNYACGILECTWARGAGGGCTTISEVRINIIGLWMLDAGCRMRCTIILWLHHECWGRRGSGTCWILSCVRIHVIIDMKVCVRQTGWHCWGLGSWCGYPDIYTHGRGCWKRTFHDHAGVRFLSSSAWCDVLLDCIHFTILYEYNGILMQLVLDTDHDYTRGAFFKGLRNKMAHANDGSDVHLSTTCN